MNVLCGALHPKRFFLWNPKTVSFLGTGEAGTPRVRRQIRSAAENFAGRIHFARPQIKSGVPAKS
jgi:hypothetical protein